MARVSVAKARFIPARAGNADGLDLCLTRPLGSSPRVRGTRRMSNPLLTNRRFIPARAGNASRCHFRCWGCTVHPRACGERRWPRGFLRQPGGSSPRVRGTPAATAISTQQARFIPARAGNARNPLTADSPESVHPRACGERVPLNGGKRGRGGSSPRVRGTRQANASTAGRIRFIPARAGNAL